MPDSHWLMLTFERVEKLQFDSVARKLMSPELLAQLSAERDRLMPLIQTALKLENGK